MNDARPAAESPDRRAGAGSAGTGSGLAAAWRHGGRNARIHGVGFLLVVALACTIFSSRCEGGTPPSRVREDAEDGRLLDPQRMPAAQTKGGVRCTLTSVAWEPDQHPEKCGENMLTFAWQVEDVREETGRRYQWCAWNAGAYDEGGKEIPVCGYHWSHAERHIRRGDDPKRPSMELRIACRRADSPPADAYRDEERVHLGEVDLGPSGRFARLWGRKAKARLGTVGIARVGWVRRADLPGGERTPSLEMICLLHTHDSKARPSFALKPKDVVDGHGRDLVTTLIASAPASAFGHNWPGFAEAWVFYFQPDGPPSTKLNISVRLRSGLATEYMEEYFRVFKFRVKTPKPPATEGTHTPLARQTRDGITLTIQDCSRPHKGMPSLCLVWTTVKGPLKNGNATEVTTVTAWDSEGRELERYPGSPLLSDPPHQSWKRDGSIPASDEVAQKFFFLSERRRATVGPLKLHLQCSAGGPAFTFDLVPVRSPDTSSHKNQ